MTSAPCRLLCGLLVQGSLSACVAAASAYPFLVTSEYSGGDYTLVARNGGPAPVSVRLVLNDVENIAPSRFLPVYAVVRPHSDYVLLQVRPAIPGRPYSFSSESLYSLGSFYAEHDARAVYRLPFENGRRALVTQGSDGPRITHTTADSEHAVDFTLPEGAPVVAARDGIVIESESANRLGGQNPVLLSRANFVRILHADDTLATYAHLAPGGVKVQVGQRVNAGSVIGRSGATGYASGPHLHFVVQKLLGSGEGFTRVSLPIRFYTGNPTRSFVPRYRQTVTADYQ